MQMHQIRYFLALCEERNFTRAARRCGVSQPSLTNAIIGLERELGGALFQRKPLIALTVLGGRAGAGRCAVGEFRAPDGGRDRAQSVISIELIASPRLRRTSDFAHGERPRVAPLPTATILKN